MINPRFSYWKANPEPVGSKVQKWYWFDGAVSQVRDVGYSSSDSLFGPSEFRYQRMDADALGRQATRIE